MSQHALETEFRGLIFLESIFPEWTGSNNGGMVIWEPLDKECSAISQRYDPNKEGALEAAKDRIKKTVLYCRSGDEIKGDEPGAR